MRKLRKKICILSFSNVARDGRVLRQVDAARQHYDVDVVAQGEWTPPAGVRYLPVRKTVFKASALAAMQLFAGNLNPAYWERYYWRRQDYAEAIALLKNETYDLIHANDLDALPVAAAARGGAQILFDAHEFYLEQGESRLTIETRKPYIRYLLNRYRDAFTRMITVSDGIARLYAQEFGFTCGVIMNAPYYARHEFRPADPARIQLINHGGAAKGRRIENLIDMAAHLEPRFHLNLMLQPGNTSYYESLRGRAMQVAPGRITFHDPVPPAQIAAAINRFDVGVHMLHSSVLNHVYALPNKLFEYVMAGLCVAVTPQPEMKRIIESGQAGIVSSGYSAQSLAFAINSLTVEKINLFKKNSLELAKTLNADVEMAKLTDIYAEALA